eukprot:7310683-Heterocapsa_arctica.AAC.1
MEWSTLAFWLNKTRALVIVIRHWTRVRNRSRNKKVDLPDGMVKTVKGNKKDKTTKNKEKKGKDKGKVTIKKMKEDTKRQEPE